DEREGLLALGEVEHERGRTRRRLPAFEFERQIRAVAADQAYRERNQQRTFLRGARGFRPFPVPLAERHEETFRGGVIARLHTDARRPRLGVPTLQLREIAMIGIGHCMTEVVAGDRLAVVSLEIKV